MATLSIRPDELLAKANELAAQRQAHIDLMRRMRILVMSLSESWMGEAELALRNRFMNESRAMENLADTLQQYIILLRQAAESAGVADRELAAKARRID